MAGNIAAGAARLALPAATAYFGSTVPAGAGENEFARQAKYGAKPTPASGRTGAGMNKTMNRVSSTVTSKPAAAPSPKPAAAPASAPAKSSFYKGGTQGDYTIKRGDTLSGIAKRTGQSVSDLASMNKISDVNKISSGAKLMTKVPTPPSRPADVSSTPAPSSSPTTTKMMKTNPSHNSSDVARSVAKTPYGSTQSVATSLATSKPAQASGSDITDKATYDTKTTKPAPFQPGPSSVKLSPEPQKFSGSAEGPAPVAKPANLSTPAPSTRVLKTSPASNDAEVADAVARGGWMDPNSVKNAPATDRAWIGNKSDGLKPEKTPGATFSPAPAAPAPAEKPPEPKKKEAGTAPAAPMAESVVTVGANKYRIV